jgi:hypothetical protein
MHPLQVAAQFAAYVWFSGSSPEKQPNPSEALRFARDQWTSFIPSAYEGLGRLLIRIAERPQAPGRRARPRRLTGRKGDPRRKLTAAG